MSKKIVCKPAPEIELQYTDGAGEEKTLLLRFDVLAIEELQEEEGGITEVLKKKFSEMCATLIYVAAKNNNDNFEREDARRLVACMSLPDLQDIVESFTESFGTEAIELNKEYSKNLMAQFLR